jgi:hypothetical protein
MLQVTLLATIFLMLFGMLLDGAGYVRSFSAAFISVSSLKADDKLFIYRFLLLINDSYEIKT